MEFRSAVSWISFFQNLLGFGFFKFFSFFFVNLFILFIYGCVESSFLCEGFL